MLEIYPEKDLWKKLIEQDTIFPSKTQPHALKQMLQPPNHPNSKAMIRPPMVGPAIIRRSF